MPPRPEVLAAFARLRDREGKVDATFSVDILRTDCCGEVLAGQTVGYYSDLLDAWRHCDAIAAMSAADLQSLHAVEGATVVAVQDQDGNRPIERWLPGATMPACKRQGWLSRLLNRWWG